MTAPKRMEVVLRDRLKQLFEIYGANVPIANSTMSHRIAGDARFFDKLEDESGTFTVRRYDQVVASFAEIWPRDVPWPKGIDRLSLADLPKTDRKPRGRPRAEPAHVSP